MLLQEIIQPDGVLCNAMARSKKHCLEILSELLARRYPDIPGDDVFEALVERERLGCTSLNKGAAFPHCRIKGIETSSAGLIKLSEPVDFDSPDGEPVDIVFGMMLPKTINEDDRTDIRCITALLSDEALRTRLRAMNSSKDLYEALVSDAESTWRAICA